MKLIKNLIILISIFLTISPSIAYDITFLDLQNDNEMGFYKPIVLITGFEPFNGYEINPSQLIAETLNGQNIEDAEIIGIVLPVNFTTSVEYVIQAITDYNPLLVISLGLSPVTHKIDVEKCGINLRWVYRNNNSYPIPKRLNPCGPLIRISPLHTKRIVLELKKVEIPSRQSFHAGFYVCNAVLYGTLNYIKENKIPIKAGFIHVPFLSSQHPDGMDLETMISAVKLAIKISL